MSARHHFINLVTLTFVAFYSACWNTLVLSQSPPFPPDQKFPHDKIVMTFFPTEGLEDFMPWERLMKKLPPVLPSTISTTVPHAVADSLIRSGKAFPDMMRYVIFQHPNFFAGGCHNYQFVDYFTDEYIRITKEIPKLRRLLFLSKMDSYMLSTCARTRPQIISEFVKYLRKNNFNGVLLRFLYADKYSLLQLMQSLREELTKYNMCLALYCDGHYPLDKWYVKAILHEVDYFMLKFYDENSLRIELSGLNYPLRSFSRFKISDKIATWEHQGLRRDKMVLLMTTLSHASFKGLGDITDNLKQDDYDYYQLGGALPFSRVCAYLSNYTWDQTWDKDQCIAFAQKPFQGQEGFIKLVIENTNAFRLKAKFVVNEGMKGIALTNLEGDDYRGLCGSPGYPGGENGNTAFPLIKRLNQQFINEQLGLDDPDVNDNEADHPVSRKAAPAARGTTRPAATPSRRPTRTTGWPRGPEPIMQEWGQFIFPT